MNFFRSFRVLLVTAILVINLCILPFVVGQVMDYVEEGYGTQFVDNARSTASLLSAQLSTMDIKKDRQKLSQYLDDLIGLGHLSFAQLLPDNDLPILPPKSMLADIQFIEDIRFGQHDDNMYFIAGPFFDASEKMAGLFRFGFDESVTEYQRQNAIEKIAFYAVLFFVLSAIVIFFVANKFTQPIQKIKDAANAIAEGNTDIKLNDNNKISELRSLTDSLEHMRSQLVERSNAISSNETYVTEIMNNIADALIVIDENWRVHDMNWEAQKLFRSMREEVVGKEFSKLFSEDLMRDMKNEIDNNSQDSLCFEWAGCQRRGICLYLEIKLSIAHLNTGTFIVCSARDMTIRKEMEGALLDAKKNAEQANNAKSTFLSTMSHELRTPLNAIIGYSDLLIEDAIDLDKPLFVQDLRNIHASGTHLLSLINNILDLSKIEAGKMNVDISKFTVQNLLDEILVTLRPVIEANNNVFNANEQILDITLETDMFKLKQVFINLISNAAKFTSNGEIKLDLNKLDDKFVEFGLHDTGIGIAEEDIEHLFDSFFQVDTRSNRKFEGTGLGLTISRKFTRLLGGDIRIESEKGKGATFFVRLPLKHPSARSSG